MKYVTFEICFLICMEGVLYCTDGKIDKYNSMFSTYFSLLHLQMFLSSLNPSSVCLLHSLLVGF